MKSSFTIAIAVLLFVALGCSLDKLTGKKDDVPTPVPESTASSDSNTAAAPETSPASSTASSSDLSIDKFNKIDLGMSYDDVKGIMGSEGVQTSMSKSGSYESMAYEWKGDKFARISVRFANGELAYKSQSGLTPPQGTADLDLAKFNNIKTDMSYEEVKNIIGSDGEMSSLMKIGKTVSASYRWRGPKYQSIFATFRDDKLTSKQQSSLK